MKHSVGGRTVPEPPVGQSGDEHPLQWRRATDSLPRLVPVTKYLFGGAGDDALHGGLGDDTLVRVRDGADNACLVASVATKSAAGNTGQG